MKLLGTIISEILIRVFTYVVVITVGIYIWNQIETDTLYQGSTMDRIKEQVIGAASVIGIPVFEQGPKMVEFEQWDPEFRETNPQSVIGSHEPQPEPSASSRTSSSTLSETMKRVFSAQEYLKEDQ